MQDDDERPQRRYRVLDDLRDVQRVLGIDPEDPTTTRELAADLYYLRELRERDNQRRRETVRQIIISVLPLCGSP